MTKVQNVGVIELTTINTNQITEYNDIKPYPGVLISTGVFSAEFSLVVTRLEPKLKKSRKKYHCTVNIYLCKLNKCHNTS